MKEEKPSSEIQRLTDPERMVWAAAFVARYIWISGEHLMPADRRRSAVHAAYLQVSSCRSALGEINVTGWTPSQMLHEMFAEPEDRAPLLESDHTAGVLGKGSYF